MVIYLLFVTYTVGYIKPLTNVDAIPFKKAKSCIEEQVKTKARLERDSNRYDVQVECVSKKLL